MVHVGVWHFFTQLEFGVISLFFDVNKFDVLLVTFSINVLSVVE